MKAIFATLLALISTTFVADARPIQLLSFRELCKWADLIVVAKPISSKDTGEQTVLAHIAPDISVFGLSTEFEVSVTLKGDTTLKKIAVHHYRMAISGQVMMNGPTLASFDPKESVRYLLFLRREPDGRYASSDQVDPGLTSMLKLADPGWDKMKLDDFKQWLDAMKWLDKRPNFGKDSPEIPPGGTGEGSLHEAALNGKLEKAEALIKANPKLVFDQHSYAEQAPLHLAVQYGNVEVAKLLLVNKADVEAKANGGWTPLLNAVFGGNKAAVELLLEHQADVNVKEEAGRTPLHVAAENGYTEIAKVLLAHKAEIDARNGDGMTPLHVAAALGYKDIVLLLLGNNADFNVKDKFGKTPLDRAVEHNHSDIVEMLRLRRHDGPD
jgi:hypothetical protein